MGPILGHQSLLWSLVYTKNYNAACRTKYRMFTLLFPAAVISLSMPDDDISNKRGVDQLRQQFMIDLLVSLFSSLTST